MHTFTALAEYDGTWWVFTMPELTSPAPTPGHTIVAMGQTRHIRDIIPEATGLASMWTDIPTSDITISVTYTLPEPVTTALHEAETLEAQGQTAIRDAATLRRDAVRQLHTTGRLSQGDIATILGVSRQRIQQLLAH